MGWLRAEERMVCRLFAGERWIRTFGSAQSRAMVEAANAENCAVRKTSKFPLRIASNQGPVGYHALVRCSAILLHSSMSQVATYLKGWSTLRFNNSKLRPQFWPLSRETPRLEY